MWHHVDVVLTDISEECIGSIFRVEGKIRKYASEEPVRVGASRLMLEINSDI
jgi:predicted transcriptional regulator